MGDAVVQAFGAMGASLVLVGRDHERGQRYAVQKLGCPAQLMLGDVADSGFADQVIASTVERYGKVDVLVNSAGIIRRGTAVETSDDDWRQTFGCASILAAPQ
ncbi:SDR family oxidoreductase [Mesorhizobium sp. M0518]